MLQSMKTKISLVWRQSAQNSKFNVIIMPRDVGISMMNDIMFSSPVVGTTTQHIQRPGGHPVDNGKSRVSSVTTVMLDTEANGRHRQTQ